MSKLSQLQQGMILLASEIAAIKQGQAAANAVINENTALLSKHGEILAGVDADVDTIEEELDQINPELGEGQDFLSMLAAALNPAPPVLEDATAESDDEEVPVEPAEDPAPVVESVPAEPMVVEEPTPAPIENPAEPAVVEQTPQA